MGIAQALLGTPKLLIQDEPTVGLDPTQIIEIRSLIKDLKQDHTIILSSHILSEVSSLCGRILIISDGVLIANDTPEHLGALVQSQNVLSVTVACSAEQARAVFGALDQVERMELTQQEDGSCTAQLYQAGDGDIQEAVFRSLHEAGYKVLQMGEQTLSLEDVFLSLLARSRQEKPGLPRQEGE